MAHTNRGKLTLELKDAYGEYISDAVELRFRNLRLQSYDFLKKLTMKGAPVQLEACRRSRMETGKSRYSLPNTDLRVYSLTYHQAEK